MNRKSRPQRRGNVVVLSAFLMMALMAMVAFAVDIGYIAEAHTQLQRSADASALAAACKLPNLAQATLAATNTANQNKTSITPALKSSDIVFGFWNRRTSTFTSPKPVGRPYNAVKITLRRTAANGNALGLFFGRFLGRNTTDVIETAIAFGDRGLCGPFIGIEEVKVSGGLTTDSYDSYNGLYNVATAGDLGSLCSDGDITVGGNADIEGDVRAGEGDDVTLNGNSLDITGQIGNRETPLSLPPVDLGTAQTTNNNDALPTYKPPMSGWIKPYNSGTHDFSLLAGAAYTMPPGVYCFKDFKMVGGSILNITGKTTIYITGNLDRQGGAILTNLSQQANNLQIFMTGGTAQISSDNDFYGVIYGPNTDITYSGSANYYGAMVGKTLTILGDAVGHYDESLDVNMGAYSYRVMIVD
jgi:Putative Flp pilus-assembly TadE/G-like